MTSYVVQDRTLATKWAISVADGELKFTETLADASSEPIVEDYENTGEYWKLFIDNGEFGFETTLTVQNDSMLFTDETTSSIYQLAIIDGQGAMIAILTATITKITRYHIVRYSVVAKIVMNEIKHKISI